MMAKNDPPYGVVLVSADQNGRKRIVYNHKCGVNIAYNGRIYDTVRLTLEGGDGRGKREGQYNGVVELLHSTNDNGKGGLYCCLSRYEWVKGDVGLTLISMSNNRMVHELAKLEIETHVKVYGYNSYLDILGNLNYIQDNVYGVTK